MRTVSASRVLLGSLFTGLGVKYQQSMLADVDGVDVTVRAEFQIVE